MKIVHTYALYVLLLFTAGCAGTLAPEGVYKGDKVLYDADAVLETAHSTVDTFLVWEMTYRDTVPKEVTIAADKLRVEYPKYHKAYFMARDAYVANPSPENKVTFESALGMLRLATAEALKYMAPNPTK